MKVVLSILLVAALFIVENMWGWITTAVGWLISPFDFTDGWTHVEWFEFLPIVVAFLGFVGVIRTLRQKTQVDDRTEWWRRYTWAEELRKSDSSKDRLLAFDHLKALVKSDLATASEAEVIELLSVRILKKDEDFAREIAGDKHKETKGQA